MCTIDYQGFEGYPIVISDNLSLVGALIPRCVVIEWMDQTESHELSITKIWSERVIGAEIAR